MGEGAAAATTTSAKAADTSAVSDALKRATDAAESLRARSDLAAKVLAAGGTTLVTAVGISKFSDLWPFPGSWSWLAAAGVIAGFMAMVVAVLGVAYRHWKLGQPTPFRADLGAMAAANEISNSELTLVEPIYEEFSRLNQVDSLETFEARAHRFERIGRWLPETEAVRVRGDATFMYMELLTILARAKLRVLRDRATVAVRGGGAIALYGVFAAGVLAFGLGADWLQSERTDRISIAKACADARAVAQIVEMELPDICGQPTGEQGQEKTATSEIETARASLATAYADCLSVAAAASECDSIRGAIDTLPPP
jgi:hypothetical protein